MLAPPLVLALVLVDRELPAVEQLTDLDSAA